MKFKILYALLWAVVFTLILGLSAAAQCPAGYNQIATKNCYKDNQNMQKQLYVKGKVGINTTTPTVNLDVRGSVYFTDNVATEFRLDSATGVIELSANSIYLYGPTIAQGSVTPIGTMTYNLGDSGAAWDSTFTHHITIVEGAGAGKVLASDANGNALWQNGPGINVISNADTIDLIGSGNYTNTRNGSVAVSTVPLSTSTAVGSFYLFMNEGSNNWQIDADNTLDFYVATTLLGTLNIPPGESRYFYCNGVNWFVRPN